ncbi:hypothetical protein [Ferrigenium kumadai]|uniref:hypothetical protein n=1 Tax=Ferrigenium kumadai TaxID=1682490 RepID=UPI001BB3CB1A|nr:hypothetical protein [Ferrigenium kumadai]
MGKTRTPPSLNWLINKRARLLGEINKLQKSLPERLEKAQLEVAQAEIRLAQAKEQLAYEKTVEARIIQALHADLQAIDTTIGMHEILINPASIPPIRSHSTKRILPYGEITRCVFDCLKYAGGGPLSTLEIAAFIASNNDLELSGESFRTLGDCVRHRLKNLRAKGKVERVNETKGPNKEGLWALPRDVTQPVPAWQPKVTHRRA